MLSTSPTATLQDLIARAKPHKPIRVAVVAAEQRSVLDAVREAYSIGLIEPFLIGDPNSIRACAETAEIDVDHMEIAPANTDAEAGRLGVEMVRKANADAVMKGDIHTDTFMHALLDKELGLRVPGQRVSHVFVVDIPSYPKLLAITDAAINIAPELNAKAEILRNAIGFLHLLGIETPKAAVLSAVETVNPAIPSTLDAACLALMAQRGQIVGAIVDGPLAFDNAISIDAAREKGIVSEVAGAADILLVPDLVSGNILAKSLEYLAGATAAGIVLGLSAPVVLSSRADPPQARLAALALAVLMHRTRRADPHREKDLTPQSTIHCAAQPESACCPVGV